MRSSTLLTLLILIALAPGAVAKGEEPNPSYRQLVGHHGSVLAVAFTHDGTTLLCSSRDRTDKFWDPRTFKLLHTIHDNPGRSESMCFSPDGKLLATGFGGTDFTIRIWDLSPWENGGN